MGASDNRVERSDEIESHPDSVLPVDSTALLFPQSHNFRLDQGWIAKDEIKEVRIDGIEAVAETDEGRGDV